MKISRLLVVLLLLLQTSYLLAQEEDVLRPHGKKNSGSSGTSSGSSAPIFKTLTIGAEAGLDYGMFSQNLTGFPQEYNTILKSGSGVGFYLSLFADENLTDDFGLQVRLSLNQKSYGNKGPAISTCDNGGVIVPMDINYEWNESTLFATGSVYLRANVSNNFMVLVGPTVHSAASIKTTAISSIVQPGECFYNLNTPQQSKTQTVEEDNTNSANSNVWSLDFSLAYKITMAPKMSLVPRLGFHYMLSPYVADGIDTTTNRSATDRLINSIQAGLGLWITI